MPVTDVIELPRKLGARLGPPAVVLVLCVGVLWYRWQLGWRDLHDFATDPLLWGLAVVGMLGCWIYYERYGLPWPFGANQIGILVTSIPGDQHRVQQNTYVNTISTLLHDDSTLRDVVKVKLLRRELPQDPDQQHAEALQWGRRLRASLVIRPVVEVGGHRPWLTIVDLPEFSPEEVVLEKITTAQLGELDELPLPKDVTLLARCALALSYYRRELYAEAVRGLDQILAAPELRVPAPPRPYLSFLCGNCNVNLRYADPVSILPRAVAAYDHALREWTRERDPTDWAMTMNNRGAAYRELPGPDRAANLREAIRCCDEALGVYTRDRYPTDWAMTMNNRGNAYGDLPGPDRAANLQEAVRCFDEALKVYTRERYPADWAGTMNNRGNAYGDLPGPDRPANLKEAIRCYDEALGVYTRDRYPTQWAMTMNNRGTAYEDLPGPDRPANLKEAIRCYDLALEVRTRERYPTQWAMTMYNRGDAYRKLPGPDRAANLQEAIRCLDEALKVYTRERYPTQWASTMNNRGNAYGDLPAPDREANLKEAIRCFDLALPVLEEHGFADYAAIVHNNRERAQYLLGGLTGSA